MHSEAGLSLSPFCLPVRLLSHPDLLSVPIGFRSDSFNTDFFGTSSSNTAELSVIKTDELIQSHVGQLCGTQSRTLKTLARACGYVSPFWRSPVWEEVAS